MPAVSVVLPVFNGMPYLPEAVRSIQTQTFSDFEFIILDNGSTDGTVDFIRDQAAEDARIKLFLEPRPLGMVGSSNAVVKKATEGLVARMDADDVAHPERLASQIEVFARHPEVVLVGPLSYSIDGTGKRVRGADKTLLFRRNIAPFAHGSIMFRKESFEEAGGYRLGTEGYEDQDLYRRMSEGGEIRVLTRALHGYRFHTDNWTSKALDRYEGNVLIRIAAQRIWSGQRAPRLSPAAMSNKHWRHNLQTVVYCSWGYVSPKSLRFTLASLIALRNIVGWARLKSKGLQDPIQWSYDLGPSSR